MISSYYYYFVVSDIPLSTLPSVPFCFQYTISGKKVEVAVKRAISGMPVPQRGALSNPECIDQYYNVPQLQNF